MGKNRVRLISTSILLLLIACQSGGPGPNPTEPTLTLTPVSLSINAGDDPVTFTAIAQNSTETITWTYSGPGSIAPTSGPATSYTPPASVESPQSASLTATLGTTGVTVTAPILIDPADGTPPTTMYSLLVTLAANGKVTAQGINCGIASVDCTEDYEAGSTVILSATPEDGYLFDSWGGACRNESTSVCTLVMDDEKIVNGVFEPIASATQHDLSLP